MSSASESIIYEFLFLFFFFKKWLNFVDASDKAAKYRFSATNCSELLVGDHLKSTWHYLEAVGI